MNEYGIFKKALDVWGVDSQLDMVVEECAELIQAVQKLKRVNAENKLENLAEEVADVEIMLDQLFVMFPEITETVPVIRSKKIKKMEGLLE